MAAKVTAELSIHVEDLVCTKQSDKNFTDPTSTAELQSLNLWLLKTAPKD